MNCASWRVPPARTSSSTVTQRLDKPTAPYYIGKGKAELIKDSFQTQQVTSVIFDNELSPAQGRNLEHLFKRKVLDRTQLILDIFAQRARSREGRLQIELAQLQYLLPRLTRMWTHLSRQTGGIGTRGPGETQLEVDRRRVQERIAKLERELEGVRKVRSVQREGRRRHQWPVAAVVGYTNAGKSTLLNLLTGADVLAVDRLFATLDPTTRSFTLPNKQRMLLTDTVGFLRNLPHMLIESFKATLEEVRKPICSSTLSISAIRASTNTSKRSTRSRRRSARLESKRCSSSTKSTRCRIRNSSTSTRRVSRAALRFPRAPAKA